MESKWEEQTDEVLADEAQAGLRGQGAVIEGVRRLRKAIETSNQSMEGLTEKIKSLTAWLLWITVAIGALTAVQVLVALKVISR